MNGIHTVRRITAPSVWGTFPANSRSLLVCWEWSVPTFVEARVRTPGYPSAVDALYSAKRALVPSAFLPSAGPNSLILHFALAAPSCGWLVLWQVLSHSE